MRIQTRVYRPALVLVSLILLVTTGAAQKKAKNAASAGKPVLWERVDVKRQDLFLGPGGKARQPDLSSVTYVSDQTGGHSLKYRVKDGSGKTWIAKISDESQSETAAARLISGLGYKTEVSYLVPSLTIRGKGTFSNVRLEERPTDVKRGKAWKWDDTLFKGTPQMKGLMLMMAFINNWDMKDANNVILERGNEHEYAVSDLGVSFGKTGKFGLPLAWMIGRSRNNPPHYADTKFVKEVKRGRVKVVFNGKNRGLMKDFTVADARWLADLLTQLSDKQIRDAFRAANYSQSNINLLTQAVRSRITQLDRAGTSERFARSR